MTTWRIRGSPHRAGKVSINIVEYEARKMLAASLKNESDYAK